MKPLALFLLGWAVVLFLLALNGPDCATDNECYKQCVADNPIASALPPDHPDFINCEP